MIMREHLDSLKDFQHQQYIKKKNGKIAGVFRSIVQSGLPKTGRKTMNGIPNQLHYLENNDEHTKRK
jgi:hypothetical protein